MTAATTRLATDAEPATPIRQGVRLDAIDILRGLVIVLMVIDHVREFFHWGALHGMDPLDVATTSPLLYVTRWVSFFENNQRNSNGHGPVFTGQYRRPRRSIIDCHRCVISIFGARILSGSMGDRVKMGSSQDFKAL